MKLNPYGWLSKVKDEQEAEKAKNAGSVLETLTTTSLTGSVLILAHLPERFKDHPIIVTISVLAQIYALLGAQKLLQAGEEYKK